MKLRTHIALAAVLVFAGSSAAFAAGVSVKFKNTSKWEIHGVYLSPVKEKNWGPDQLGPDVVIKTGTVFTLTNVNPNKYDIKLVDEDGDECVVSDVKLGADQEVDITDKNLLSCQDETGAADEESTEGE